MTWQVHCASVPPSVTRVNGHPNLRSCGILPRRTVPEASVQAGFCHYCLLTKGWGLSSASTPHSIFTFTSTAKYLGVLVSTNQKEFRGAFLNLLMVFFSIAGHFFDFFAAEGTQKATMWHCQSFTSGHRSSGKHTQGLLPSPGQQHSLVQLSPTAPGTGSGNDWWALGGLGNRHRLWQLSLCPFQGCWAQE